MVLQNLLRRILRGRGRKRLIERECRAWTRQQKRRKAGGKEERETGGRGGGG
jgi:hypothetical protein